MTARLKVGDVTAGLACVLLLVSSLLHQFGGAYSAYHELLINVLIGTYLLGIVVGAMSIGSSLGVLPARLPWQAWASAGAAVVLLDAVLGAIALSRLIRYLTAPDHDPGLGVGVYLGVAAAAVLFVSVALRPLVPLLEAPVLPLIARRPAGAVPAEHASVSGPTEAAHGSAPTGATTGPDPAPPPFTPFWAAVPTSRSLYAADDPSGVVATLHPGTWYAVVAPHSHGLVVALPSGQTGILVDVADLFRG